MNRPTSRLVLPALLAMTAAGCAPRGVAPERSPALRAFAHADSLHVARLAPGVLHVRAWEASGPWAIHVLEVDTARCAPRWEARKPAGSLRARATTSSLARDALAAVNADFFQLPGGTPVGAHVSGGHVLIGPGDRPAWLWSGRAMAAGEASLEGTAVAGADSVRLVQVNRAVRTVSSYRPPPHGAAVFGPLAGAVPPADSVADVVLIELTAGDPAGGTGRVQAVLRDQADSVRLAPGAAALQAWGESRRWAARRQPGDTVVWRAHVVPPAEPWPAREVVGGFPLLLHAGRDVLAGTSVTASFAQRHPRTAIGWSPATGHVFVVAVDGRQPPYSAGMTLGELLQLFRRLGASEALNLDGGGSTAVVVRGVLQNRPSDREGERAVGNALALAACARVTH